jgi:hypothetical protein
MALAVARAMVSGQSRPSPIHFTYQPIGFRLDSCETPHRYAPETMAGGAAVFDYTTTDTWTFSSPVEADILSSRKTSAKYSNRPFENDGRGHFTDVTAKAGLAGTGFDVGVAIGDYDNGGRQDISLAGCMGITCTTTMAAPLPMSRSKPDSPRQSRSTARCGRPRRLGGRQQRWPARPSGGELPGIGLENGAVLRGNVGPIGLLPPEIL